MKLKGPGPLRTILLLGAHLNIIVGGPFKLVGKHEIEGARALWINIIIDYCCTNVLLYAKILKETEETIVFFVTFLSLVAFQLGGGGGGRAPWASSLATPMQLQINFSSDYRPETNEAKKRYRTYMSLRHD